MERTRENIEKISEDLSEIKTEIAILKTQSTIWGAIGGFVISTIVTIAASAISYLF